MGEIRNKYVLFGKSEAKSAVTSMDTWSKEKVRLCQMTIFIYCT
jgi:hypothetical protein